MNNPYQAILNKASVRESLKITSQLTQQQLEQCGTTVDDEDFENIQEWAFDKIRRVNVQAVIFIGGLLTLVRAAAYLDLRMKAFYRVTEELDISITKAYDSIAIFRCFGRTLLDEEALMARFRIESLKILSANSVSEETRQKAILMAVAGKDINIKAAEELVGKRPIEPSVEDAPLTEVKDLTETTASDPSEVNLDSKTVKKTVKSTAARIIWLFSRDEKVRLVVETNPDVSQDEVSIPELLRAAMEQYEQEAQKRDVSIETTIVA